MKRRRATRAEREASRWIARLEADDVTLEDHQRFRAWLAKSDAHRAAHRALSDTWDKLDAIALVGDLPTTPAPSRLSRRALLVAGGGGAITAAAAGGVWLWSSSSPAYAARYETGIGGRRRVDLRDGSNVELNADTGLDVHFTRDVRLATLRRGEALFNVRSDRARPFVVRAARASFIARGTSFLVKLGAAGARLSVLEGHVDADVSGAAPVRIGAGQEARLAASAPLISSLPADALAQRLAWRDHALSFDNEPLGEAALDVTAQTGIVFVFADPALRDRRVGGYISAESAEPFIHLLETNLALHVERKSAREVVVSSGAL